MSFISKLLRIKNELDNVIENNGEEVEDENKTNALVGASGLQEPNSLGEIEESDFSTGSWPVARHRSAEGLSNHRHFLGPLAKISSGLCSDSWMHGINHCI